MAEEVKKSRPAPDPNSAKFKLGQIAAKAYSDAMEAKKTRRDGWLVCQQLPGRDPGDLDCMSATRKTRQLVLQQEAAVRECVTRQRARATPTISAHMHVSPLLMQN